jgi:hypothetical protein
MNYLILFLSVIALTACSSMPVAPVEERSMQKVHDVDLTKNEIYDISLEWMSKILFYYGGVVELSDKDKGMITGTGMTSFYGNVSLGREMIPCRFTIIVEAKDKKYRTTYRNLVGLWGRNYHHPKELEQKKYVDDVKAKLAIMDEDLYNYLKTSKSNTNW